MNFDSVPGNRGYHLPKSVLFNEKRPRKPETNKKKNGRGSRTSKMADGGVFSAP